MRFIDHRLDNKAALETPDTSAGQPPRRRARSWAGISSATKEALAAVLAWGASGLLGGCTGAGAGPPDDDGGISGGSLIVRDASTGALLWTFAGDGDLSYTPVLASGHVYVASSASTYAIDTSTHAQVWKTSGGGFLAIASGRLIVARSDGTLAAYLLSK